MSATVWLVGDRLATLEAEARRFWVRETGGPLFGYETADGDLVVTEVFGPGPNAKHQRFRLVPDPGHTQAMIDQVAETSGGRDRYLGEWHSHPLGRSRPSDTDVNTLIDIAAQAEVQLPRPLALIQQTKPYRRRARMGELGAFRWDSDREQLGRLAVEVCQGPPLADSPADEPSRWARPG
jgi:integrative and conjugative element protein (TIGR02256 family)